MKKIYVDIDDTLAETTVSFLEYLKTKHNILIKKEEITKYGYNNIDPKLNDFMRQFSKTNFFNEIIPLKDSIKVITNLSRQHELIIVSGRPNNVRKETEFWTSKFFPNCFSQIHLVNQFPQSSWEG